MATSGDQKLAVDTEQGYGARTAGRPVTLEVDDVSGDRQATWSVTVTGDSHPVEDAATLAALWSAVRPQAWESSQEAIWISLSAEDVQGQRVRTRHRAQSGPSAIEPHGY